MKYITAKCSLCKRPIKHGELVVAVIPTFISKEDCPRGKMRLKLSPLSISGRTKRVYCKQCLNLDLYIRDKDA